MYCRKCGKFIESDLGICYECQNGNTVEPFSTSTESPESPVPPQTENKGRRMDGFGSALAAAIMSPFAYAFALYSYIVAFVAFASLAQEMGADVTELPFASVMDVMFSSEMLSVAIVLFVMSLGLAIPSIVIGIKSIKLFKTAKAEGRIKPIPAFALGIAGVFFGVCAVVIALCSALMLILTAILPTVI